LAHALERFRIEVEGRTCLDVGASTGGFTDCLLRRGAARVIAVDVGRGQLDWRLRRDPRVSLRERCNARYLDRHALPEPIDLAAVDVSFISLRMILPALLRLDLRGPVLALVKPQFELRRGEVGKGGVVRDPLLQRRAVEEVGGFAAAAGLPPAAAVESPLTGAEGNREFFLLLGRDPGPPSGFLRNLEEIFHGP
ncbi:MAG: TlyA family RNA methyltransferase, partial [Acidobacteria bacterium]|nr:TlyA family RNA methyltransferase [Acidobacteriota bacterium]